MSPDLFEQGWKEMKLGMFIILLPHGSPELDPSVLIDPFLIGIFPQTFPWKRLVTFETETAFAFESRQKSRPECHIANYLLT